MVIELRQSLMPIRRRKAGKAIRRKSVSRRAQQQTSIFKSTRAVQLAIHLLHAQAASVRPSASEKTRPRSQPSHRIRTAESKVSQETRSNNKGSRRRHLIVETLRGVVPTQTAWHALHASAILLAPHSPQNFELAENGVPHSPQNFAILPLAEPRVELASTLGCASVLRSPAAAFLRALSLRRLSSAASSMLCRSLLSISATPIDVVFPSAFFSATCRRYSKKPSSPRPSRYFRLAVASSLTPLASANFSLASVAISARFSGRGALWAARRHRRYR